MTLYQYRGRLTEAGFGHLEALLLRGEMMFSRPSDFNDPFDCYPSQFSAVPGDETSSVQKAMCDLINQNHQALLSVDIGVVCFTPKPDNHLMWSHYGDGHKGVCVGFDDDLLREKAPRRSNGEPIYIGPEPVTYTTERPVGVENLFCWKSDVWSYEEEHRLITDSLRDNEGGPGVGLVPADAVTEIVLGARISALNTSKVCELVSKRRPEVTIKCIVPEPQSYGLSVELLSEQPVGSRWHDA